MSQKSTRVRVNVEPDDADEPVKRGRGRPVGSTNKLAKLAVENARQTGELPHEFLLRVTRGEVIATQVRSPETGEIKTVYQVPDLPMRISAANQAAPYFAPKLSAVQWMQKADDDELDKLIAGLAAQAGLGLGACGEGQESGSQEASTGQAD